MIKATFIISVLILQISSKAILDLSDHCFYESGAIPLNGEWLFYPYTFFPDTLDGLSPRLVDVPGSWRSSIDEVAKDHPFGYGLYRLRLLLPRGMDSLGFFAPDIVCSYRIWIDGQLIGSVGSPGRSAEESEARISARYFLFPASDTIEIFVDVSNYGNNTGIVGGGIMGKAFVATPCYLRQRSFWSRFIDLLLIGGFLFTAIVFLLFYVAYRLDRSYLYLSCFILTITTRFLATNSKVFFEHVLLDSVSWEVMQRLEMAGFYGAVPFLLLYVTSFFSYRSRRRFIYSGIILTDFIMLITLFVTPSNIFMLTLHPFQVFTLFQMAYILYIMIKSFRRGENRSDLLFVGVTLTIFFIFATVDILRSSIFPNATDVYLSSQGMVFFVLAQGWLLATKYRTIYAQIETTRKNTERNLKIIELYTRRSIVDFVKKGHNPLSLKASSVHLNILFSDIRDFTTYSDSFTPYDTVELMNRYFSEMSGCISENGGEIDKLIGNNIMALFVDSDDAVRAAIKMRQRLLEMNRENSEARIYSGVGINFGEVIIGNIGSDTKLDYTVIGDSVNAASRIEALTKYYKLPILVSESVIEILRGEHIYRFVDRIRVKGRGKPLTIYEIYDHEPEDIRAMKREIQPALEAAFSAYERGEFGDALIRYRQIIDSIGPHRYVEGLSADPLINFYIDRCVELQRKLQEDTSSWNGVYEFSEK